MGLFFRDGYVIDGVMDEVVDIRSVMKIDKTWILDYVKENPLQEKTKICIADIILDFERMKEGNLYFGTDLTEEDKEWIVDFVYTIA